MNKASSWFIGSRYYFNIVENFFFRRVCPVAGFALLLIVTTPIGDILTWKPDTDTQLSLLIFFSVSYGSKLLHATLSKGEKKLLSFSSQDSAIENALILIPQKGTDFDILIYTSFSLFSNLDNLLKKYPQLERSKVRILLRDPDFDGYPMDERLKETRKRQLGTVLDSLSKRVSELDNFEVKFYSNEPWVRGIKVGESDLFFSSYSSKNDSSGKVTGEGYSGSSTPWIYISKDIPNILPREIEPAGDFISSFSSLFNFIWNKSKHSKSIILDLDGTLYVDPKASSYFKNKIPKEFHEFLIENNNTTKETLNRYIEIYNSGINSGLSSTGAILNAANFVSNVNVGISEYLNWKDEITLGYAERIKENKEIVSSVTLASEHYNIYILTNHTRRFTERALERLGFSDVISSDNVITINDLKMAKPNIKIPGILMRSYNIDITSAIFIGDRKSVDLDYNDDLCLGSVLVRNVSALPSFLNDCWLPFSWLCANSAKYPELDLKMRNNNLVLG